MIEIGDEFNVNGNIGMVCYKGNFYNQDYICIAFENEGKFGIYKVKYEDDKYFVAEEKDKNKCAYVLAEVVTDDIIDRGNNNISDFLVNDGEISS